jgi:hypothetical protein
MTMIAWSSANAQTEGSDNVPGAFTWDSGPAPRPPISMIVNLRTQRGYVYRDGALIRSTPISSGKPGYRTPTGTFNVLEKQRVHHSNKYDNAPMPYMQRLTWYGVALHAGHVPGYPASHGCVRMPASFARWLYSEPTMGMTVVITDRSRPERSVIASSGAAISSSVDAAASRDDDGTDAPQ